MLVSQYAGRTCPLQVRALLVLSTLTAGSCARSLGPAEERSS
jgi:hypothetical protein